MKTPVALLTLFCLCSQTLASIVVHDTNIVLNEATFFGANYSLTVYQDAAGTDPTTVWLRLNGSTLSYITTNVDEGSDWYGAQFGQPFNTGSINANLFPLLVRGTPSGFEFNDLNVDGRFFLGVNTGNSDGEWSGPGLPPRNVFGWVELQNVGGTLTMLDNAVSYDGAGIVIGVPEPGAALSLLVGVGWVAGRRRQRRGRCTRTCSASTIAEVP